MFLQLFENLEALPKGKPIRVFWQMQHYSGAQCAPFTFNRSERKIALAMKPKEVEEVRSRAGRDEDRRCASVDRLF